MLKNFIKTAFRNLAKQKGPAGINLLGLAAGIACFSLFMLYAVNEFSFENFHKNANNLYRVYLWFEALHGNPANGAAYHPMPLGPALKKDFPDIENYTRFREGWPQSFVKANDRLSREEVSFADPSFFSMFSFKLRSGDPATALKDIHSIVLTESTAKKLFSGQDPVNKTIEMRIENKFEPFTVTAIAADPPSNSTIQFKILGNFEYLMTTPSGIISRNDWDRAGYQTYVQIRPGSRLPGDKNRMVAFRKKYYPNEEVFVRKMGWTSKDPLIWFGFQPIRTMHTGLKIWAPGVPSVNPSTIWIVLGIAAGILIIACINFTTLAIGRSAGRAKEIGVRKVMGGSKNALIVQFLTESLMLTILSSILGLGLAKLLLPFFNTLSERNLQLSLIQFPDFGWLFVSLMLVVGILAGIYPAFILSDFKAAEVLKTRIRFGGANIFTKSLVTFQFMVSAGLIISTVIILQQLHFMQSKNPGFNKQNVLVLDADGIPDLKKIFPLFRQELESRPAIAGTAIAESGLGDGSHWSIGHVDNNTNHLQVFQNYIDTRFLGVLGLQLLAGRNFNPAIASDTVNAVIINERMARDLGWTNDQAIGREIKGFSVPIVPVVIGVVKNFNFQAFNQEIQPQLFHQFSASTASKLFVLIKAGQTPATLSEMELTWKKFFPGYPFQYSFLDEDLDHYYKSESRWSLIIGWAGGVSILLASLGLIGLTALTVVNRSKEMGIRKILGASFARIFGVISKDFLKLILLSLTIATPLTWLLMTKWLQDYPYRIDIRWWVFAAIAALIILISILIIGFKTMRFLIANPLKELRTE